MSRSPAKREKPGEQRHERHGERPQTASGDGAGQQAERRAEGPDAGKAGQRSSSPSFVNPYTFVPLPEVADEPGFRGKPSGHHRLPRGHFSGHVEVELEARSPLLLRGVRKGEEESFPRRVFEAGADGDSTSSTVEPVPFLPGSSLAGATRSLHELLAGGCLRVFDPDFLPVHRDVALPRGDGWTLAVVEKVASEGRPVSLRLCSEVVWVAASVLAHKLGGAEKLVTGARVAVNSSGVQPNDLGRREVPAKETARVSADEPRLDWVVLVTDSGARSPKKQYWCAVGRLSQETDGRGQVTEEAWRTYRTAVDGADDIRQARQARRAGHGGESRLAPVSHGDRLVGYRHKAHSQLFEGQVVWAHATSAEQGDGSKTVDEIALSAVWRHVGNGPAGERAMGLEPCHRTDELCPSCRVFGSADTRGADDPSSRQRAYRGHVRFSDARPVGDVPGTSAVTLAPLGAPRPGAGQFYLKQRSNVRPRTDEKPLREWGSRADTNDVRGVRPLRGRKQYWLTQQHTQRPYFRATRGTWKSDMASRGEYLKEGARFRFTVHVDGLDRAQLGGVLVALCPSLLFGEGTGLAVGGGKPLGFGTCISMIAHLDVADATARYTGVSGAPAPTVDEAVAAFRERVPSQVRDVWPAARSALTLDRVPSEQVWYPPAKALRSGILTTDDLSSGFGNFWQRSQGQMFKQKEHPLTVLPDATAEDQSLPVHVPVRAFQNKGKPKW